MKIKWILIGILTVIFLFVLIIPSCADNTDNQDVGENPNDSEEPTTVNSTTESPAEIIKPINYNINFSEDLKEFKENLSGGEKTESVLIWSNFDYSSHKSREEKEPFFYKYDDTLAVNTYLQERGMFKETPDKIIYGGESYIVEYYVNGDKRQTSFIIYFKETSTSCCSYGGGLCCMTISWDDLDELGSIKYDCNQNGDAVYEDLYNADGEHITNLSYEYFDGVPLPFIKENAFYKSFALSDKDIGMYSYFRESVLNRNQKFWFYRDFAVFDAKGKVAGINDDTEFNYNHFKEFLYDENGRLKEIREHFSEDEKITMPEFIELDFSVDFSGTIRFDYRENDKLSATDYGYFYYNHPTYDFSGHIHYDEQGRMIYKNYYVTHGCHTDIYLYDGDSKRPWAYIEMCEGCNPFVIYLFPQK